MRRLDACGGNTHHLKGQLVFEFIIAAVLLMGIIVFVLNILSTNVSIFTNDYFTYSLENKAITVSEVLVKTSGGIGLAAEWPVLDSTKIEDLDKDCNMVIGFYPKLLTKLDLLEKPAFGTYNVRILIHKIEAAMWDPELDCKPTKQPYLPGNVSSSHIVRFAILDTGEPVNVSVWVW